MTNYLFISNSSNFKIDKNIINQINSILINEPIKEIYNEKKSKPIGWIFRKTLDYVSLDKVNGDWSRKFLWSCQIVKSDQLKNRLKNKINKFIKSSGNKVKEHKYE